MAYPVIVYNDLVYGSHEAAATLTGDAAVTTLPLANLQDPQPSKPCRWIATSGYVVADFGALVDIGGVALAGLNLSAAATWRVRLSTADATGAAGNAADTGVVSTGIRPSEKLRNVDQVNGRAVKIFDADVSARYLRVDLADASLGYIDAGLLLAGPAFRPSRNFSYGWGSWIRDRGELVENSQGLAFPKRAPRQRRLNMTFQFDAAADVYTEVPEMLRLCGGSENCLFVGDPGGTQEAAKTVLGLLDAATPIEQANFRFYNYEFAITERL